MATWDDTEVARRWLLLCPLRKTVDLNPIRAALAETLKQCDVTLVQRRIQSLPQSSDGGWPQIDDVSRDCFLAPLAINEIFFASPLSCEAICA
ncbi:MAG TPA: hypothetical protein VMM76_19655 [Pirellulaceae bacterium]|nr:hypothetical protein [Pirellulaceae bacterium]